MPTLKFNSADEFLEELRKTRDSSRARVWPPIVRLTFLSQGSSMSPNVRQVSVVSAFNTVWVSPEIGRSESIVRLDIYCGDDWRLNNESDRAVRAKAEAIAKQIEDVCKELGYEVREGMLEEGATS